MEKAKRKAFNDVDLTFNLLLDYKKKQNDELTIFALRDIDSKIDLLLIMDLITFEEWEFVHNAIFYVWRKGVA